MGPQSEKSLRLATYASVATALILILAKLLAWLWTDSVSLLASLVDSLMDSLASVINLLAVRYSLTPADNEHRYGHGKAEPLAGLVQVGFIVSSALFLMVQAVERFNNPVKPEFMAVGIGVMLFATAVTIGLVIFQRQVIRQTDSTAIRADSLHYTADILTNISVIIALFLSIFGWLHADAFVAMGIAIFVFYSAIQIGYDSFQQLMDRELPDEQKEQILKIAKEHPHILGVHEFKSRRSGQHVFIQMHLELDGELSLYAAHQLSDQVEKAIAHSFPNAEIIIHKDPVFKAQ